MKTFLQWAESNNKDLKDVLTDIVPNDGEKHQEKADRTGLGPFYPPAYKQGQYPKGWFAPIKATWQVDSDNAEKYKGKVKKDAGETPL